MKKIAIISAFVLVFLLAACSAENSQEEPPAAGDSPPQEAPSPLDKAIPLTPSPFTEESGAAPIDSAATAVPPTPAPTATDSPAADLLPILGPAPEWNNTVWINSDSALPLADLRGKVVLLEFWTFG